MEWPTEAPSMVQMDGKSVITEDSVNFNDLLVSDIVLCVVWISIVLVLASATICFGI